MTKSMTVDQMSAFQTEYYDLYRIETKTTDILNRIVYLEGIFENIDLGKILIDFGPEAA
jgi:hypothetical protein